METEPARGGARHRRWASAFVWLALLALTIRLGHLIQTYAVDVPFWDHWDLYTALIEDADAWSLFRWQHGPHRQGLGFLLTAGLAHLTGWNLRAEAFLVGVSIAAAAAVALALRRRLFGPLEWSDMALPLLILTPAQYGIFIHTPNPAHGALPLLLLLLYCAAWSRGVGRVSILLISLLNFVAIHTGFGLFIGLLTPGLLAAEAHRLARAQQREPMGALALGGLLAVASGALFFVGYTFDAAIEGFRFPDPDAHLYPVYAALMFANVMGIKGTGVVACVAGGVALCACVAASGLAARGLWQADDRARAGQRTIFALSGFTLLFCANTAIGRVSLGLSSAQSTRYVPLVVPGFIAILWQARGLLERHATAAGREVVLALLAVGALAATTPMRAPEARFMRTLARAKLVWATTYRETGNLVEADRRAGRRIYPWAPETTRLSEKLDYLRRNRLSLFRESETGQ